MDKHRDSTVWHSNGITGAGSSPDEGIGELRDLLLGPEKEKIEQISQRYNNPDQFARDVSRILAEAIKIRDAKDDRIARAIAPSMEKILHQSVKKNPAALANAIYPVLGPAIRKAISTAILGMMQSLNHLLNNSFSLQSLRWRYEAIKTKKSFAEVVLLHTLIYQVEQVFFIHRKTGLMLAHVLANGDKSKDPDLVSGMLSAIQDFVHDSFGGEDEDLLDTLRIGNSRTVWVEQGPFAFLAVVIRGTPPMEFREDLRETVETIHLQNAEEMEQFNGDTTPFLRLVPVLESCLQFKVKETTKKKSVFLWLVPMVLIIGLCFWGIVHYQRMSRWHNFMQELRSASGITITEAGRRSGGYHIAGLKDPLAADPATLSDRFGMPSESVTYHWTPYLSMSDNFILARAIDALEPPTSVEINYTDGKLTGKGFAGHRWIRTAMGIVKVIPGISAVDFQSIVDMDTVKFNQLRDRLESKIVYFMENSKRLLPGQEENIKDILTIIQEIRHLGRAMEVPVNIMFIGHTDSKGSADYNLALSRERAAQLLNFLTDLHISPVGITVLGIGESTPTDSDDLRYEKINRSVTFEVVVNDAM
ncbi:MAG: OmpA family protein [Desulfobacteraceae bacterium]|nr:OmpA family protein [Desulfobacteraceae bacterium]